MGPQRSLSSAVSPSEAVVEAVADQEGVDSTALESQLYDTIDPDALDTLLTSSRRGATSEERAVTFQYCGYRVVVDGAANVTLVEEGVTHLFHD